MDDMKEGLKIEMVPDGIYHHIAEQIGVDNLIKLAEIVGGTTFYMPKAESLLRPVRDAAIKEEFNGYNHTELALKYNVTERWIRHLCGVGMLEGQIEMFGT